MVVGNNVYHFTKKLYDFFDGSLPFIKRCFTEIAEFIKTGQHLVAKWCKTKRDMHDDKI